MNHSEFLAKLTFLKFTHIRTEQGYDTNAKAAYHYTFSGEVSEGILSQCESLEWCDHTYQQRDPSRAVLTRLDMQFSVLMPNENYKQIKASLENHSRVTIQMETAGADKTAVNIKLIMGVGTPDDIFNDIKYFREIGVLQPNWTANPPFVFGPTFSVDNTVTYYKRNPDELQNQMVHINQQYIDYAKKAKVYPFAKIVHPGIGTHALY